MVCYVMQWHVLYCIVKWCHVMMCNVVPCNIMQCNVMGCYGMFCYLIWRVGEQKHFVRVCIPSLRWKQPLSLIARNFALTRRTHSFSSHLNMGWVIQCGALFTIAKLVQNNSNNYGVWYLYLTYNFIVFMGFINQLKNQLITGGWGPIFKFCITVIPASQWRIDVQGQTTSPAQWFEGGL